MRKSLGAVESVPADSATKSYSDALQGVLPPSTYFIRAQGMLGTANSVMTAGRCTFHPIWLKAGNYDQLAVVLAVAQVSGTVTTKVGLYKDAGNGSHPLTSGGPVVSGTVAALTGTLNQNRVTSFTSTYMDAGMYWVACVYLVSSAPSTAPQVKCVTNNTWSLPVANTLDATTVIRGLYLSSQTDLPTGSNAYSAFTISASNDVPTVCIRAA